jgi:endonuclease G
MKFSKATCLLLILFFFSSTSLFASGRKDSDTAKFATAEELHNLNTNETKSDTPPTNTVDSVPKADDVSNAPSTILLDQIQSLEVPLCPAIKSTLPSEQIPVEPTSEPFQSDIHDHEVHQYNGFELCYREKYEVAEWVAYKLTAADLITVAERTDDFRADTKISSGSATPQDYSRSGYDRGHLAPAADMEWSEKSVHDSFLMSNMTPQAPSFNRGMWKDLESQVRTWANRFGEVFVVTGPILEKDASEFQSIGQNKVAVPEYFYKVLLSQLHDETHTIIAAAFILPNTKCEGTIYDYMVSIDEVERRTGIDFFFLLPDDIEIPLEQSNDISAWNK